MCQKIEDVFDVMEMDDADRDELLKLSAAQMRVRTVCMRACTHTHACAQPCAHADV